MAQCGRSIYRSAHPSLTHAGRSLLHALLLDLVSADALPEDPSLPLDNSQVSSLRDFVHHLHSLRCPDWAVVSTLALLDIGFGVAKKGPLFCQLQSRESLRENPLSRAHKCQKSGSVFVFFFLQNERFDKAAVLCVSWGCSLPPPSNTTQLSSVSPENWSSVSPHSHPFKQKSVTRQPYFYLGGGL